MEPLENNILIDSAKTSINNPLKNPKLKKNSNKEELIHISPSIFVGQSVFLFIHDKINYNHAKKLLEIIGATIVIQNPLLSDIIIADEPFSINEPIRSRGAKLTNKNKLPKIIYINKIPWIFDTPLLNNSNYVIISEINQKCRPIQQIIKNLPILFFENVPKGYTVSPFTPLPDDIDSLMNKIKSQIEGIKKIEPINGPNSGGYCELCSENFTTSHIHRNSPKHEENSNGLKWFEFDEFSNKINENFVIK